MLDWKTPSGHSDSQMVEQLGRVATLPEPKPVASDEGIAPPPPLPKVTIEPPPKADEAEAEETADAIDVGRAVIGIAPPPLLLSVEGDRLHLLMGEMVPLRLLQAVYSGILSLYKGMMIIVPDDLESRDC